MSLRSCTSIVWLCVEHFKKNKSIISHNIFDNVYKINTSRIVSVNIFNRHDMFPFPPTKNINSDKF